MLVESIVRWRSAGFLRKVTIAEARGARAETFWSRSLEMGWYCFVLAMNSCSMRDVALYCFAWFPSPQRMIDFGWIRN